MRKCKRCNGSGFIFVESNSIFTGKDISFLGLSIPETTSGYEKITCTKCFGKGVK